MSNLSLCSECNLFPTTYNCTICKQVLVCPMCLSSHGYDDLNNRPCVACLMREHHPNYEEYENDVAEPNPKRIRLDDNNNVMHLNVDTP